MEQKLKSEQRKWSPPSSLEVEPSISVGYMTLYDLQSQKEMGLQNFLELEVANTDILLERYLMEQSLSTNQDDPPEWTEVPDERNDDLRCDMVYAGKLSKKQYVDLKCGRVHDGAVLKEPKGSLNPVLGVTVEEWNTQDGDQHYERSAGGARPKKHVVPQNWRLTYKVNMKGVPKYRQPAIREQETYEAVSYGRQSKDEAHQLIWPCDELTYSHTAGIERSKGKAEASKDKAEGANYHESVRTPRPMDKREATQFDVEVTGADPKEEEARKYNVRVRTPRRMGKEKTLKFQLDVKEAMPMGKTDWKENEESLNDLDERGGNRKKEDKLPTWHSPRRGKSSHPPTKGLNRNRAGGDALPIDRKFPTESGELLKEGVRPKKENGDVAKPEKVVQSSKPVPPTKNPDLTHSFEHKPISIAVKRVSTSPVHCPLGRCRHVQLVPELLQHLLYDQHVDHEVLWQECFDNTQSLVVFRHSCFAYASNRCLCILVYGGVSGDRSSLPAEKELCGYNKMLPKRLQHLNAHLPILLMGTQLPLFNCGAEEIEKHSFFLWLLKPPTTRTVYGVITVFNKQMTYSCSASVEAHDLKDKKTQPNGCLTDDISYLRLTYAEVKRLTKSGTDSLLVDVKISVDYNSKNLRSNYY